MEKMRLEKWLTDIHAYGFVRVIMLISVTKRQNSGVPLREKQRGVRPEHKRIATGAQ